MNSRPAALSFAILAAAFLVSSAQAQTRVVSAPTMRTGTGISRFGGSRTTFIRPRGARRFFDGSAFVPYFYPDYDFESETVEGPPPRVIVVQPALPALPASAPLSSEPLVLELRGDQWVRVKNGQVQTDGLSSQPQPARSSNLPPAASSAALRTAQSAEPPRELPRAVLIFRDGHQEEVAKYLIVGTTIYTSADYWSTGSWTREVHIADLDVPATLKLNQERGAKFNLPSGPNEVMIRP